MTVRTGIGYDCHRLVEGRPLVLGGVVLEHDHGLLGHSDAGLVLQIDDNSTRRFGVTVRKNGAALSASTPVN